MKGQELIHSMDTGGKSEEFYAPSPKNYEKGKTKYVIITGSVISGIGKGIFTASLSKLFANRGLKVSPIKLEAYLNVDAGTLNPYRHGEVFVLDDGTETDMDLGSYERYLDENLTIDNYITSGRIYMHILEKERKGEYLGRDVQFIPHVTGETKLVLRNLASKSNPDVILLEIGGTVGDYENLFAMEAIRELIYEEGKENVCIVNLAYILEPSSLGEFKSKAAQNGIKRLLQLGIQPDVIVCRSENPIPKKIKEKISLNVNVPVEKVVGAHNVKNIYTIPKFLRDLNVDEIILDHLKLNEKYPLNGVSKSLEEWTERNTVEKPDKEITVGIAGKYMGVGDAYISILKALEHCEAETNSKINIKWINTDCLEDCSSTAEHEMEGIHGLIVPGAFGKRGAEGKIACIKYARENNIPYLGLCFGFQMALIEFARNVLGMKNANSTEINPETEKPVVCILPEQLKIEGLGGNMRLGGRDIDVKKGSKAFELYGNKEKVRERFRHRFECNPDYIEEFEKAGVVFSGKAPNQPIMQILEYNKNDFFMASQFHPEFTSRPLKPNPLFLGFVKACIKK